MCAGSTEQVATPTASLVADDLLAVGTDVDLAPVLYGDASVVACRTARADPCAALVGVGEDSHPSAASLVGRPLSAAIERALAAGTSRRRARDGPSPDSGTASPQ